MGEISSFKFSQKGLEFSQESPYYKSMKNKNTPIEGSIMEGVSVRTGVHKYDDRNRTVVELTFQSYNCSYVQVIDIRTAADLIRQLREQGIAQAERVSADEVFA